MAKQKKRKRGLRGLPWYWEARDYWVVPADPKKTALRDKNGEVVRGADNREQALAVWHEMMSLTHAGRVGAENEVKAVLELYLKDLRRREATDKTLGNYTKWFQSFVDLWKGLLVQDLKPFHVHEWWERSHPEWGPSLRNLSGSALKAAFNWASKAGKGGAIIPVHPLDGMVLPTMKKKSAEVVISEAEFERLLGLIKSQPVRDILMVAWDTGTRPVNLSRATAQNLTDDGKALLFAGWNTDPKSAVHKTFKRTGRPLVVPLPSLARGIISKLKDLYPEGPLFRTSTGLEWTDLRLANIVLHYAKRAGLEGRFTAYSCRHTLATRLLEDGVSVGDVAAMLGNTPSVIADTYSHVAANVNRLLKLRETTGGTRTRPGSAPVAGPAALPPEPGVC